MMKQTVYMLTLLAILGVIAIESSYARYEDTIPPEILRRFDPAIVKGERPRIVRITQPMIWGLRNKPDQGGEVYSFDLDPKKISTVQKEIIRKWVRAGQKILFWGGSEAEKYSVLFADKISWSMVVFWKLSLSKHPVNIDVRDIRFKQRWGLAGKSHVLNVYPPDTEVIVSSKGGVVAGRVPYGRGNIYIALMGDLWSKGTDRDRWTLNFRQWMLGFRVPGPSETETRPPATTDVQMHPVPQDRILLKNGDTISGRLLVQHFTIKTSYADLTFKLEQIESVILEGAGQNVEMLVLRSGDKLSGLVGPESIKVKLAGGQETEIEKDKIKQVLLQR